MYWLLPGTILFCIKYRSLTVANVRDGDLVDDAGVEPVGGRGEALHRRVQALARREHGRVVPMRRDRLRERCSVNHESALKLRCEG